MHRLIAIAIVTVAVVVACDTVPLTSPTGSTISISIDKNILPINGQATITAVVTEVSGTAVHNGTVVTFQPSIGSVNPPEAKTVNGVATATFLAGALSGSGVIHAFSGPARTGSGNATGGAEVRIGAAAAGAISVSATPPSISQSGGTVTISALVLDAASNTLPGVAVIFSANAGALSASTALTDDNGIARTTLTTTQTTTVTARTGSVTPATVDVVVSAPPSVEVVTGAGPFTVGVPVAITIDLPTPTATTRQIASIVVDFGDGTQQRLTNVTGDVGLTHTYGREGGYTITATASDVGGNTSISSKAIVVNRQQNPTVSLSAPASTTVATPIAVAFSATAPAANTQIVSARVTLQDGTVIYSGSNANNFNYKFSGSGTYTLTGTVTDSNGNSASASTTVFVSP
jgi:hypothetical protein